MPSDTPILTDADITPAEAWDSPTLDNEGFVVELPSKKVIRARRMMNMMDMIQKGQIPNPLREIVMTVIAEGDAGPQALAGHLKQYGAQFEGMSEEDTKKQQQRLMVQFQDMINRVVCLTVLKPTFSMPTPMGELVDDEDNLVNEDETPDDYFKRLIDWKPDPGTVSIFNMNITDRMFMFNVSQGAVADAKRFRQGQEAALAALADVEGAEGEAERTGGGGSSDDAPPKAPRGPSKSPAKSKRPAAKKSAAKRAPAKRAAAKKAPAKKAAKKRA